MGFLNKLFGGKTEVPELDPQHPARREIEAVREGLMALTQKTTDRLEVVPAAGKAFVFVGAPPKKFGLVWVQGKEVKNLKNFLTEKGIDQRHAEPLVQAIGAAYERNAAVPRYRTSVAGRDVVVTPSEGLAQEVGRILEGAGR